MINKQHFAKQLGATIAAYRQNRGLTQEQVSERLGISNESVSRMEHGVVMPNLMRLIEFADIFQCSVADLMIKHSSSPKDETAYLASLLDGLSETDKSFVIKNIEQLSGHLKKHSHF